MPAATSPTSAGADGGDAHVYTPETDSVADPSTGPGSHESEGVRSMTARMPLPPAQRARRPRRARPSGTRAGAGRSRRAGPTGGPRRCPRSGSFDVLVVMGSDRVDPRSHRGLDRARADPGRRGGGGRQSRCSGCASGASCWPRSWGPRSPGPPAGRSGGEPSSSADPVRIPSGPWLVWHEDAFTAPPGSEPLAWTDVSLHAFVSGVHTGVQFHPEVTAEIVGHWVDVARARGHLDPGQARGAPGRLRRRRTGTRRTDRTPVRRLRRAGRPSRPIGPDRPESAPHRTWR